MTFDWTLPKGFTAGEPQYPVPDTLLISGLMNHVYKGDYAVLVPLKVPAKAAPGSAFPITLDAQWLACTDEVCVPERGRMTAQLRIAAAGNRDVRFDQWRARLPAPLDAPARFAMAGKTLRLAIPLPASVTLDDPHVFVASDRAIDYAAPQNFSRSGDTLVVELRRPLTVPASPESIEGVLRLGASGVGLAFTASPGEVPPAGLPLSNAESATLPLLLAGALLGGLLLNLMPCVFPILSLKAMSLVRAGESEAQARREGLAYTAGVIARLPCARRTVAGAARGWRGDRLGIPVAGTAGGGGPAAAGRGDHRQFSWPIRADLARPVRQTRNARSLRDRTACGLRGDALHRPVHGGGHGRCAVAADCGGTGTVRRAWTWACAAVFRARIHSRDAPDAAQTGCMDDHIPALDGAADGIDGAGAAVAGKPPGRLGICPCLHPVRLQPVRVPAVNWPARNGEDGAPPITFGRGCCWRCSPQPSCP